MNTKESKQQYTFMPYAVCLLKYREKEKKTKKKKGVSILVCFRMMYALSNVVVVYFDVNHNLVSIRHVVPVSYLCTYGQWNLIVCVCVHDKTTKPSAHKGLN